MELLEASAKLERIEVLAKIVFLAGVNARQKDVALQWIEEIAEETRESLSQEMKSPLEGGNLHGNGGGFQ